MENDNLQPAVKIESMENRAASAPARLSVGNEWVEFRPALPADEGFLFQLYRSTRLEELAILPWTDDQKSSFLWHQFATQHLYYHQVYPDAQFSVIQSRGENIGRLYLARGTDELRIIDVALLPEWRNRGIGSALLQLLLREGSTSRRRVSIHVEKNNPALRLYQRHGFREVRDNGVYLLMECVPDPVD